MYTFSWKVIGLSKLNKKQSKLDQLKNVYLRDSCVVGDSPPVGAAQHASWRRSAELTPWQNSFFYLECSLYKCKQSLRVMRQGRIMSDSLLSILPKTPINKQGEVALAEFSIVC